MIKHYNYVLEQMNFTHCKAVLKNKLWGSYCNGFYQSTDVPTAEHRSHRSTARESGLVDLAGSSLWFQWQECKDYGVNGLTQEQWRFHFRIFPEFWPDKINCHLSFEYNAINCKIICKCFSKTFQNKSAVTFPLEDPLDSFSSYLFFSPPSPCILVHMM